MNEIRRRMIPALLLAVGPAATLCAQDWSKVTIQTVPLANDQTKVIPGHGPMMHAAELQQYRDMLAAVRDRARSLVKEGRPCDQIIAARPTRDFDDKWGRSWLGPDTWVGLIYDAMIRG